MIHDEMSKLDSLYLKFYAAKFPYPSEDEALDALLDVIERNAGELTPTKAQAEGRKARYTRAIVKKQFSRRDLGAPSWNVNLTRQSEPNVWIWIRFDRMNKASFFMRVEVKPFAFYQETSRAQERAQRLVSLVRDVARIMPAAYAFGHSYADATLNHELFTKAFPRPTRVSEMYWLNVYGAEMVDAIGRERVLLAPAAHLEELPNGAVLLLTRPTPADFDSEVARLAQARAVVHLDPSLSFDNVLSRLRDRSAALVPVERHWDPDLEHLFERVLDATALGDRQREIARFNRLRPTVTEWLPLEDARRSDFLNVPDAVDDFRVFAELLVESWWRKQVPELKAGGPSALLALDRHLWQFMYGRDMKKEELENTLLPGVGAFLGEMMVKELGGRWVPRVNRDESYVVLGDRAWLPFLRARHCLGPERQCVLDYSLNKFYREAERYIRGLQAKS